jgi:hypothetical protein
LTEAWRAPPSRGLCQLAFGLTIVKKKKKKKKKLCQEDLLLFQQSNNRKEVLSPIPKFSSKRKKKRARRERFRFLMEKAQDDLAKALCYQVEVELQLVKGWIGTATVYDGGVFFVRGRFDSKSGERSVFPHSASTSLSPAQMQRFLQVVKGPSAQLAIVERDGACSFFELAELTYTPPTLPTHVYNVKQ